MSGLSRNTRNLMAAGIGVLPVYLGLLIYRLSGAADFSPTEMILFPLVIGGVFSLLILVLNRILRKETFRSTFNPGKGSLPLDVAAGAALTAVSFALLYLARRTLYVWLPPAGPPVTGVGETISYMADRPLLLAVWFGPVLWIGIAGFEELSRVFLLVCLWELSDRIRWHVVVLVAISFLIGLVHIYQGWAGVLSLGLKSLIMGFYYYRTRRFLPLVLAHALYDGVQFALLLWRLG